MHRVRLSGLIMMIVGLALAVLAGLWLATQTASGQTSAGGAVLGAGLAFIPVALLIGFGFYQYSQGGAQAAEESTMQKQRKLLDILKSRGQVSLQDMAVELQVTAAQVQEMVHQLVGLQVFSGYANWTDGVLYSTEASQLRQLDKCKNCGGDIQLAGKGVVVCRFCGTEYFLS